MIQRDSLPLPDPRLVEDLAARLVPRESEEFEELVQETWARLLRERRALRATPKWVMGVLKNVRRELRRGPRSRRQREQIYAARKRFRALGGHRSASSLEELLAPLREQDRVLLTRRYVDQASVPELAAELGLTVAGTKSRLEAARSRFRGAHPRRRSLVAWLVLAIRRRRPVARESQGASALAFAAAAALCTLLVVTWQLFGEPGLAAGLEGGRSVRTAAWMGETSVFLERAFASFGAEEREVLPAASRAEIHETEPVEATTLVDVVDAAGRAVPDAPIVVIAARGPKQVFWRGHTGTRGEPATIPETALARIREATGEQACRLSLDGPVAWDSTLALDEAALSAERLELVVPLDSAPLLVQVVDAQGAALDRPTRITAQLHDSWGFGRLRRTYTVPPGERLEIPFSDGSSEVALRIEGDLEWNPCERQVPPCTDRGDGPRATTLVAGSRRARFRVALVDPGGRLVSADARVKARWSGPQRRFSQVVEARGDGRFEIGLFRNRDHRDWCALEIDAGAAGVATVESFVPPPGVCLDLGTVALAPRTEEDLARVAARVFLAQLDRMPGRILVDPDRDPFRVLVRMGSDGRETPWVNPDEEGIFAAPHHGTWPIEVSVRTRHLPRVLLTQRLEKPEGESPELEIDLRGGSAVARWR